MLAFENVEIFVEISSFWCKNKEKLDNKCKIYYYY